jgi:hypothetical protein
LLIDCDDLCQPNSESRLVVFPPARCQASRLHRLASAALHLLDKSLPISTDQHYTAFPRSHFISKSLAGDLRRSATSASTQSRYDGSLSPGQSDNLNRRASSVGYRGIYAPLSKPSREKRLVVLEPALSDDEDIRCDLKTTNLAKTKYEVLSYAWGDETEKTPILLNGRRFLVTRNLEHALRSLRAVGSDSSLRRAL